MATLLLPALLELFFFGTKASVHLTMSSCHST